MYTRSANFFWKRTSSSILGSVLSVVTAPRSLRSTKAAVEASSINEGGCVPGKPDALKQVVCQVWLTGVKKGRALFSFPVVSTELRNRQFCLLGEPEDRKFGCACESGAEGGASIFLLEKCLKSHFMR